MLWKRKLKEKLKRKRKGVGRNDSWRHFKIDSVFCDTDSRKATHCFVLYGWAFRSIKLGKWCPLLSAHGNGKSYSRAVLCNYDNQTCGIVPQNLMGNLATCIGGGCISAIGCIQYLVGTRRIFKDTYYLPVTPLHPLYADMRCFLYYQL